MHTSGTRYVHDLSIFDQCPTNTTTTTTPFDYKKIVSLGNEAREKLTRIKPRTLGQASRISGINPSDVQILMVYMGR